MIFTFVPQILSLINRKLDVITFVLRVNTCDQRYKQQSLTDLFKKKAQQEVKY